MIRKAVAIYLRRGRAFVHPMAFTKMGVLIAVPPFQEVTLESLAESVRALLALRLGKVPHPTSWDLLYPLFEMSGAKSWQDFARDSSHVNVDLMKGCIRVSTLEWDGKGFTGGGQERELPEKCSDAELQKCLESCLCEE